MSEFRDILNSSGKLGIYKAVVTILWRDSAVIQGMEMVGTSYKGERCMFSLSFKFYLFVRICCLQPWTRLLRQVLITNRSIVIILHHQFYPPPPLLISVALL